MKNTLWKIWSIEHQSWWNPARKSYTPHRAEAGVYSYEEACEIVRGANIGLNDEPNEAMIEAIECYKIESDFRVGHEKHEIALRKLGNIIKPQVPSGMGFTLLMFDYGEGGNMFYLSSADREGCIKAMREFIGKNVR